MRFYNKVSLKVKSDDRWHGMEGSSIADMQPSPGSVVVVVVV